MALTASWKPGTGRPVLTGVDRATPSGDDRPDPDAPVGKGQGPLVFLRPERVLADTEPLAVADHGHWKYVRAA